MICWYGLASDAAEKLYACTQICVSAEKDRTHRSNFTMDYF